MRLPQFILVAVSALTIAADTYQPWPKAIKDLPNEPDTTIIWNRFTIRYFIPDDPDIQMAGGSGGPMGQIDITDVKTKETLSFNFQTVGARILEEFNGFPQFEIWGRAGGGSWSRCLYRFQDGRFKDVRIDDFIDYAPRASNREITATLTRDDQTLYYVETRYPDTD